MSPNQTEHCDLCLIVCLFFVCYVDCVLTCKYTSQFLLNMYKILLEPINSANIKRFKKLEFGNGYYFYGFSKYCIDIILLKYLLKFLEPKALS